MTAVGKIPTAQLQVGDVVLYTAHPYGEHWIPAWRKDRGTYAGRVESITSKLLLRRGERRAQRFYEVVLSSAGDPTSPRHITVAACAPAQTWWLASASAKWRAFLGMAEGDRTIKSAIKETPMDGTS